MTGVTALLLCGISQAQEPASASSDLANQIDNITSSSAAEKLVRSTVLERAEGARAFLYQRRIVPLHHAELDSASRERNLAIEIQRERYAQSQSATVEARATFDSVFTGSVVHERGHTFDRAHAITRLREEVVDFDQLEFEFNQIEAGRPVLSETICVIVDGQVINLDTCQDNTDFNTKPETASFEGPLTYSWSGTFDWSKSFRWGLSANAFVETRKDKRGFHAFPTPLVREFAPNDPIGIGDRLDWSSNIGGGFSLPLPYARNFGRYGSFESVGIDIADIERDQAKWRIDATRNLVQGDVHQQYWALVGALQSLQITVAQQEALAEIVGSTRRRYEERVITAYEMAQAEAELENVRNFEQIAWSQYVVAANALIDTLNYDPDSIILPTGYDNAFVAEYAVDSEGVLQTAMTNRNELKVSAADIDTNALLIRFRENQMRPDLSFQFSVSYGQTSIAYGYANAGASLLRIVDPDSSDYFVGVSYRLPFGKVAERSALSQSRIRTMQATDNYKLLELAIVEEVNSAIADFRSAQTQIQLARGNTDLAELAYDRVVRLQGLGLATQFEKLRTLSDLLDARIALIDARVGYHQSYARLQSGQGLFQ